VTECLVELSQDGVPVLYSRGPCHLKGIGRRIKHDALAADDPEPSFGKSKVSDFLSSCGCAQSDSSVKSGLRYRSGVI
jgi:hypothetical protein